MKSSGVEFSFKEFTEEVKVMTSLAGKLLTQEGIRALKIFEEDIRQLGNWPTDVSSDIELRAVDGGGVRTRLSKGEYEQGKRRGRREIFAELRCKWKIMPVGATGKKRRPRFRLTGLASTEISLQEYKGKRLITWQMDVASPDSPGCYFHVQVNQDHNRTQLPVPRFPNLLVTPMAALDFVLGELFQDQWLRLTSRQDHNAQRWRSIQQMRWKRLLDWHLHCVNESRDTCSPWISIKKSQPPLDLFL